MHTPSGHRKRIKHYDEPGHCHELTFSCYRRMPLLTNDLWREMLSHSIDRAVQRHGYQLFAFVYMPEHVHLLVLPISNSGGIDKLLKALKRPFSFRVKKILQDQRSPLLKKLTIQQRPGVKTFRFWQEGPGYDRNMTEASTIEAAIDYIHRNPVRRGLCERAVDWLWSSAKFYYESQQDACLPKLVRAPAELFDMPH